MKIFLRPDSPYHELCVACAEKYGFEISSAAPTGETLEYTQMGLIYYSSENPQETMQSDFTSGRTGYRLNTCSVTAQPLLKALGGKPSAEKTILDATAGLGADSMLLAVSGYSVEMCERNQVMSALLEDGLIRAADYDPQLTKIIQQRLRLHHLDAKIIIENNRNRFHAIYLDPMFPARKKTAKVKKEMRLAALAVGDDPDAGELLIQARENCPLVIVKRPVKAEAILPGFSRQLKGRSVRFDIYRQ